VSAPGYLTRVVEHEIKKKKNHIDVVLEAIDLDAPDDGEPILEFDRDVPREDASSAPAH
jgi:hypothetical protein